MTKSILTASVALLAMGLWSTAPRVTAADAPTVRSIELPEIAPNWPDAPGREIVEVNCAVCHSSRYVMMQPAFPRKVWEASVDKMRKTFGAPIPEENVKKIVDYLMAVRGKA